MKDHTPETGVDLLWGTAQLFHERKYMYGAATAPSADVFAHATAQIKRVMEVTHRLGGEKIVSWGAAKGTKRYSTSVWS